MKTTERDVLARASWHVPEVGKLRGYRRRRRSWNGLPIVWTEDEA